MRWQTTAALAVLLALVGGFYYLWEIRLGPQREQAESRRGRVFDAEPKDATALELKRGDERVRVIRDGEAWRLTAPVATRADRGKVEETLTSVLTARSDREIDAAPKTPADFGLGPPKARAMVTLKDGKTVTLALGTKSPTGVWVYARQGDKPNVFVVSEGVLRDVTAPVADFRDRTILAFDRTAVSGVEIVTADATIDVDPAGAGKWKITRPVPLPADGNTVSELLDKLATARIKDFVAEAPAALAPYGLDRPLRVTVFTGKDKERAARTLMLGRSDADKKGTYAMRPGEPSVLLVPDEVARAVPRNVAVLRDKTVVEVDRDALARIEVNGPKGAVTVAHEGERWTIVAPERLAADQVEVGILLGKLGDLRAQAFLSDDASAIPRVLARPQITVTLAKKNGETTTLLLAPSPERRGGETSAYAGVAGRGPVVLVEGKALDALSRSLIELRDRSLFPGVETKDVARVRVSAGGTTALFQRAGDDWRMLEPSKGAARSGKVNDLLYAVRGLKWTAVVSPNGADAAKYGLEAPALQVALLKADGAEAARLAVGRYQDNRAYVRAGSAPAIYAVDATILGPLPKVPDDFKE